MGHQQLKWWIHASIWLLILLIYILIFGQYFSVGLSLLRGLANLLPMMVLFYANLFFVNLFFERKKYGLFIIANLILLLVLIVVRVQLNLQFPQIDREAFIASERDGWRLGALFTNFLVLLVSTFYQILENRFAAEQNNQQIIQQQQEAQLQFLRAQINPHFLFNTLNNIYSLAVVKSDKTADMVLRLSNLLRYVVYDGREPQVQLQREARQIQEYIELFQMRSEEPLDIEFVQEGPLEQIRLEPMILIPLIENCFKHCDFEVNPEAFAKISLKIRDGQLQFNTRNSKDDRQQKDKQGGVGLSNIRRRLALKYPGRFELETINLEQTFEVQLVLQMEGLTTHLN